MLKEYITDLGAIVAAYAADEEYIEDDYLDGVPVVPLNGLEHIYPNSEVELVLGIGYTQLGNLKREIYNR